MEIRGTDADRQRRHTADSNTDRQQHGVPDATSHRDSSATARNDEKYTRDARNAAYGARKKRKRTSHELDTLFLARICAQCTKLAHPPPSPVFLLSSAWDLSQSYEL
eukprot:6906308-Prymnesium_polylepis.3